MLHYEIIGTGGPYLLIAHGLFGSGRNWGAIAKALSRDRCIIVPDMRNHGASFWSDDHSYTALAADLAEIIGKFGSPMDVLGHSMGGKAAMALALSQPELVARLVVADIAPVTYGHDQMANIKAMQSVDLSMLTRRSEAKAQLAAHGLDRQVQDFFTQSLNLGERRWRLNLDALAANMEAILGFPAMAGTFEGPALFLGGGQSDYLRHDHRPRIEAYFPAARFATIQEAGHWLHAERPKEVLETLQAFWDA